MVPATNLMIPARRSPHIIMPKVKWLQNMLTMCLSKTYIPWMHFQHSEVYCEEDNDHSSLAMSCHFCKKVCKKKRQEIIQSTNNHHYSSSYQASHSHSHPAHSFSQVLTHNNSPGHCSPTTSVTVQLADQTISLFQFNPTFEKSSVSNAVIRVLIATVKNSEEPGTFETVLNSSLTANDLPISKWVMLLHPRPSHRPQLTPHL